MSAMSAPGMSPRTWNAGPTERVSWSDLSPNDRRQFMEDYNLQYAWGLFEDGKTGFFYQANYRYYIRSHGFDNVELISRQRLK